MGIYIDIKGKELDLDILVFEIENDDSYVLGNCAPTVCDMEVLEESYVTTNFRDGSEYLGINILATDADADDLWCYNYERYGNGMGKEGVSYRRNYR